MFSLKYAAGICLMFLSFHAGAQDSAPIKSSELIEEGLKLHNEGKYHDAISVYSRITEADSNYVLSLYEIALSFQADSQFEQGIKICEQALALKQSREREPELYALYGSIADDMEQYDRSVRIYDSAIALYPAHMPLYINKAITLLRQEKYEKAEKLLQESLLIDPYASSLHYYLGLSAINQGKVIPAFLAYTTYLLITPEGRHSSRAISMLSSISKNEDEIVELVSKRKQEPSDTWLVAEQILASKIALDKSYKTLVSIDDEISRQMQVVFEKIEFNAADKDFYMQYYVPYFLKVFGAKKFEPLVFYLFSGVDIDQIKNYNRKNKKEIQQLKDGAVEYFSLIRGTRELELAKRANITKKYLFDGDDLVSYGGMAGEVFTGDWNFFYPAGNIKAKGTYNDKGEKDGVWTFYYYKGNVDAVEIMKAGALDGPSEYYYENGIPSMKGIFTNGKRNGEFIQYYSTGSISNTQRYSNGMLQGTRKVYHKSGILNSVEEYKDDALHGPFVSYYANGRKDKEGAFENGKASGVHKIYHENGKLALEGQYVDGNAAGTWKRYHESGKLKSVENYANNELDGEYNEYYENGQLYTTYKYKKGKSVGEAPFYDEDGKLFSTILFDNDAIRWTKYFDKTGKQISLSESKGKKISMVSYSPEGFKRAETNYNENGNIEGIRNYYFPSGTLKETEVYKNGQLDGMNTGFHPNKQKKFEVMLQAGKKEGHFSSYFSHGGKKQDGWYSDDQAQGVWFDYDEQSNLSSKTEYLNDNFHGASTSYWPNSRKESVADYRDGLLESITQYDTTGKVINKVVLNNGSGHYKLLYVNGKKHIEGTYKNGELEGSWKSFYCDGTLATHRFYKNGLPDSTYKMYEVNGKPSIEGQYISGDKAGTWKYYGIAGKINSQEQYLDGKLQGKKVYYHDNGKVDLEIEYVNGELHGWYTRTDENGELMYKLRYRRGSPVAYTYMNKDRQLVPEIALPGGNGKVTAYYANGNKSTTFEFVDDVMHNEDLRFHSNGKLKMDSKEVYGNTEGLLMVYNADGSFKYSYNYLHNEKNGKFKEMNSNGTLLREGSFYNGYLHGAVKNYDNNGKLKDVHIYYYGQLLEIKK